MKKCEILKIVRLVDNKETEQVHSTALGSVVTIYNLELGRRMQLERLKYEKESERYLITSTVKKIERRENILKVSTMNSRYYLDMEVI